VSTGTKDWALVSTREQRTPKPPNAHQQARVRLFYMLRAFCIKPHYSAREVLLAAAPFIKVCDPSP
jgi:hypothetical protein